MELTLPARHEKNLTGRLFLVCIRFMETRPCLYKDNENKPAAILA